MSCLCVSYFNTVLYLSALSALHDFFFFSSRRRHTRFDCDWSSDVCSSDLASFISVVGHTAGQWVKPKNMSVGAPPRSVRVKGRPVVSVRRNGAIAFACGSHVPLASRGLALSSCCASQ